MKGKTAILLLLILSALIAQADWEPTEYGGWYYVEQVSALETAKWLAMTASTGGGIRWTLSRSCEGPLTLSASASDWGTVTSRGKIRRERLGRGCTFTRFGQVCERYETVWYYDARFRIDDGEIQRWTWRYGWNSNAGQEVLVTEWPGSEYYGDPMLIGNRLVIEIIPSSGVLVFDTTDFAAALAEHCGFKPFYPPPEA